MSRRQPGRWPVSCALLVALTLIVAACSGRADDDGATKSTLSFRNCSGLVRLEGSPIAEERLRKLEFSPASYQCRSTTAPGRRPSRQAAMLSEVGVPGPMIRPVVAGQMQLSFTGISQLSVVSR